VTRPAGRPLAPAEELVRVHEAAARFFRSQLPGSWVPGYLTGRGFRPAVQEHWRAGYAPAGWDTLTRHLRRAGYPDTLIEAAGLARRSRRGTLIDTFRDRAVLPIRSAGGSIVAFIGRAAADAGPGVPKYVNSPRTALYDKGGVLFGLWEARSALASGAQPVITEGPFDAIAVTTSSPGRYAGVAPCGTALTTRQIAALSSTADLRAAVVLVAFDADQAGQRAAVRAYHLLTPFTEKTAAVVLPAGQDPADILRNQGAGALARILGSGTRPLADLVTSAEVARWDRWLQYAEGQFRALRAAAPLIAAMPPAHVGRQVARLADQLGLSHAIVTEAVTDALADVVAAHRAARDTATAPERDLRGSPPPVIRVCCQDSPCHTPQAIGPAAATAPSPGQAGPAGAGPARLRARRVPG